MLAMAALSGFLACNALFSLTKNISLLTFNKVRAILGKNPERRPYGKRTSDS
jgi:hypothetical protein